jgi:asparagine synthase (glutamine-hydrolysing)
MIATLGTAPTVVYDGLGGALSVPNRFPSRDSLALMEAGKTRELADRLLRSYSVQTEPYLQRVLRPDAFAALSREAAVERFGAELDVHVDAPDPIKSFNFWNRIRRELALVPYGLMKHVPTVYSPYLDHDLYDFLMGMPATTMAPQLVAGDKSFHTEAIHRAFPQHRDVPFENKQAPKLDAGPHNVRFAAEASRFILRHAHVQRRLVNRRFVLPRALYARGGTNFGENRPWFASLCLYLTQLELAAERQVPSTIDIIEQHVQAA